MKKFLSLMLLALPLIVAAVDTEDTSNWEYRGHGGLYPGLFPDVEGMINNIVFDCEVYECPEQPGLYVFVTNKEFELEGYEFMQLDRLVVHAENPSRVWCENAAIWPLDQEGYVQHKVEETSECVATENYGELNQGIITFSAPGSFRYVDTTGAVDTNLGGKFKIHLPEMWKQPAVEVTSFAEIRNLDEGTEFHWEGEAVLAYYSSGIVYLQSADDEIMMHVDDMFNPSFAIDDIITSFNGTNWGPMPGTWGTVGALCESMTTNGEKGEARIVDIPADASPSDYFMKLAKFSDITIGDPIENDGLSHLSTTLPGDRKVFLVLDKGLTVEEGVTYTSLTGIVLYYDYPFYDYMIVTAVGEPAGIHSVGIDSKGGTTCDYYDMNGRKLREAPTGIPFVTRNPDGTSTKLLR